MGAQEWRKDAVAQLTRALELRPGDSEAAYLLAHLFASAASPTLVQHPPIHPERICALCYAMLCYIMLCCIILYYIIISII